MTIDDNELLVMNYLKLVYNLVTLYAFQRNISN